MSQNTIITVACIASVTALALGGVQEWYILLIALIFLT
jgi:hypothetical protein